MLRNFVNIIRNYLILIYILYKYWYNQKYTNLTHIYVVTQI